MVGKFDPAAVRSRFFSRGISSRAAKHDAPRAPWQVVDWARDYDPSRLLDTNSGGPANSLGLGDVNDTHDCAPAGCEPRTRARLPLYGSTFSRTVWRLHGGDKKVSRCGISCSERQTF
jgi:hypothetical protein